VILPEDHRMKAALLAMLAVGFAAAQDAIVKSLAGSFPAYEAVMIRGVIGGAVLAIMLAMTDGFFSLRTSLFWPLVVRGLVLCSGYYAFILSIAAMPIANGVAIYFTMPFFVAMLAGPYLGEHVPIYRWLAMIAGFIGVLVMVRPGTDAFEPASFLALYSALAYAVGQMMGRRYAQVVPPIAIANIQNGVYFVVSMLLFALFNATTIDLSFHKSLAFLSRPAVWPSLVDFGLIAATGVMAAFGSVLFTFAYKSAPSNFVAPFEYTAMIWAVGYGLVLFGDFPDVITWMGMGVVIAAGLLMLWRDQQVAAHKTG
jgi:drug/metabolite transporter (DMT)-like permease